MHIRVDDTVIVIAGDDRGVRGKVLSVDRSAGKAVIEGINRVRKHVKRSQRNPQGGQLSKEMPVPLCNIQLVCRSCDKPSRTGSRQLDDGSKERFCKKCDATLGEISPPRTR